MQSLLRKFAPLGDRVLVKRAAKEVQTASGIYLPTDTTKDPNEGEVVAVGPGERDMTGTLHKTSLLPGDKVFLPEYGGAKVNFGGNAPDENMVLFRESDILGKFD
jgi:chaperonin GroES